MGQCQSSRDIIQRREQLRDGATAEDGAKSSSTALKRNASYRSLLQSPRMHDEGSRIFIFLTSTEQGRLRSTCYEFYLRFNNAVFLEFPLGTCLGCNCPEDFGQQHLQSSGQARSEWFPISARSLQRWGKNASNMTFGRTHALAGEAGHESKKKMDHKNKLKKYALSFPVIIVLDVDAFEKVFPAIAGMDTLERVLVKGSHAEKPYHPFDRQTPNNDSGDPATGTQQFSEVLLDDDQKEEGGNNRRSEPLRIDSLFLHHCLNLQEITFGAGLERIKSIGDDFLSGCPSLMHADFSGLAELEAVGDKWMQRCGSLEAVDFSGLEKLRSVGTSWMSGCNSLERFSCQGLSSLERVGSSWLFEAESLKRISFAGLEKCWRGAGRACLGLAPNVAHLDLGAHLLPGDWLTFNSRSPLSSCTAAVETSASLDLRHAGPDLRRLRVFNNRRELDITNFQLTVLCTDLQVTDIVKLTSEWPHLRLLTRDHIEDGPDEGSCKITFDRVSVQR